MFLITKETVSYVQNKEIEKELNKNIPLYRARYIMQHYQKTG
jgi:hypothetical protein